MHDFESIISNIRSIGYFLASQKDVNLNKELKEDEEIADIVSDIKDIKLSDLKFNLDKLRDCYSQTEKLSILRIEICIASSSTLKEERNAIESYLFWKNDELINNGIYLHYNVWEKQSSRFNYTCKQEDYNKTLVYDSKMFICLIGDNVGKFTLEEFKEAHKKFKSGEKPYVFYTYFKEMSGLPEDSYKSEGWRKRCELEEYIRKDLEQNPFIFKNAHELLIKIDNHISEDIEIIKQKLSTA
jgi:hypothetical protein